MEAPYKTKTRTTILPGNPTTRNMPGENHSASRHTHAKVHFASVFTTVRTQRQPERPSAEAWIRNMWRACTREYYFTIKNQEIMPFASSTPVDCQTEWCKSERERPWQEIKSATRMNLNFYPPELKKKKKQTKFKPPSLQYFIMAALASYSWKKVNNYHYY